jgi:hypothetical protein
MELIPIIQLVLTIVASLAAATLIISYVAFKIRQKRNPEEVYTKQTEQHMEPSFVGKSIRRITRITKEIIPLQPPIKPKQERPRPKTRQPEPPQRKPEPPKENFRPRRIEVVNNLSDSNSNTVASQSGSKIKENTDLNSLGDDILNKYVDNESQNLFTLKTNKKESK